MLINFLCTYLYFFLFLATSLLIFISYNYLTKHSTTPRAITVNKLSMLFKKMLILQLILGLITIIGLYFIRPLNITINTEDQNITIQEITVTSFDTLINNRKLQNTQESFSSWRWLNSIHIKIQTEHHRSMSFNIKDWEPGKYFLSFMNECEIYIKKSGKHRIECTAY